MSLDETNLRILATSGTEQQRKWASAILPIRHNGHLLLVTLLLLNTVIQETLPVLIDSILSNGVGAVVGATLLILIFGEIIPQSICAKHGLRIGAMFAWPVRIVMYALFIVTYPLAKALDVVLGRSQGVVYRRAELKELVELHGENAPGGVLSKDEVTIIKGALDLQNKSLKSVMTELVHVFSVDYHGKFDRTTMSQIMKAGHSRVPIYEGDKSNIIGMILAKSLVLLDPDDATPVSHVRIARLPKVDVKLSLFDMLNRFQEGNSHMAIVVDTQDSDTPLGIITLEDVIEELIQEEIVDETDVFVDVKTRVKVLRALNLGVNGIASNRSLSPSVRPSSPADNAPGMEAVLIGDTAPLPKPQRSASTGAATLSLLTVPGGNATAQPILLPRKKVFSTKKDPYMLSSASKSMDNIGNSYEELTRRKSTGAMQSSTASFELSDTNA
jgi:metal transporter CNNM